jgi:hypothetical protein
MNSTSDISSFLVIFFLVESYKSFEAYVTSNKCFLGRVVEPITVKFFYFFMFVSRCIPVQFIIINKVVSIVLCSMKRQTYT